MPAVAATTTSTTTWRKLQAASGLVFGAFLLLHWASHISLLLAGGDLDAGNDMLHRVRAIYQWPVNEAILFLALALHFLSNTVLYLRRSRIERNAAAKKSSSSSSSAAAHIPGSLEHKAHRYAGYMLSVFVLGHVFATRIAPLLFLANGERQYSNYDYAAISLAFEHALPYRLLPKLLIPFAMAANWHLVYGVRSALTTLFSGRRGGVSSSVTGTHFPIPLKMVALVLHICIIGSILSLTGTFYEIPDIQKVHPEKYEAWRVVHNGIQSTLGLSGIVETKK
jgi:succinate dehydrogenase/fumarate reductase cytochrome b subunit